MTLKMARNFYISTVFYIYEEKNKFEQLWTQPYLSMQQVYKKKHPSIHMHFVYPNKPTCHQFNIEFNNLSQLI